MHDIKVNNTENQSLRIKELEIQLEMEKLKHQTKETYDDDEQKSKKGHPILKTILVFLVILIIIAIMSPNNKTASTSTYNASTVSNDSNLSLQNQCIAVAQSEDDNNPLMRPNYDGSESISKSIDMNTKIADCKAKYPVN